MRPTARSLAALSLIVFAACSSSSRDDNDTSPDAGTEAPDAGGTGTPDAGGTTTPDAGTEELTLPTNLQEAPLTVGNCPAFSACGGTAPGTWVYTGYCIPDPFAQAKTACPALNVTKEEGTVKGAIVFGTSHLLRHADLQVDLAATVPASCATFVGGCPGIENFLKSSVPNISCPANGTGDCECTGTITRTEDNAATYSVSGNSITIDTPNPRTFDYCVQGSNLTYKETTSGAGKEPGTGTLAKQ